MNNKHSKELCHSQFQGDELYHHGILGMHWGIRRYQPYGQGYNPKHKGDYVGDEKSTKRLAKKLDKAVRWGYGSGNPHYNELINNYGLKNEILKSQKVHDTLKELRDYERANHDLTNDYGTDSDPSDKKYDRYNELLSNHSSAVRDLGKQILKQYYGDRDGTAYDYKRNDYKTNQRAGWMDHVIKRVANDYEEEEHATEVRKRNSEIYQKLSKQRQKLETEAPKFYVEQKYEWLSKMPEYQGMSKSQIAKTIKVGSIDENGLVDLIGTTGYLKYAFPYVEYGINESGKLIPYQAATDD
jgi:hypothetical protein